MPVKIRKRKKGGFTVRTPKGVKAKRTTKKKAMRQARLLRGIDHGWRPTRRRTKKRRK